MIVIDTHCHLYGEEFKDDIEAVISRAKNYGVNKFYLPAIDSEVIDAMLALENKYPGQCMAMMGLHPCSVKENYREELQIVQEWLARRDFVAIGEIGLDFYWDKTFTAQQYEAFELQMQWAVEKDRPIVIHTRNAMKETIDCVKPFSEKGLKGIFHCFGGNYSEAVQIIDMGFYLGIGGVLTYKKSGLAEVMAQIGLKQVVLETDAPYLTPVPFRGKRNESSYLQYIIDQLAEINAVSAEEVAAITTANAEKILGS
jgi:TatD DNase family protein